MTPLSPQFAGLHFRQFFGNSGPVVRQVHSNRFQMHLNAFQMRLTSLPMHPQMQLKGTTCPLRFTNETRSFLGNEQKRGHLVKVIWSKSKMDEAKNPH